MLLHWSSLYETGHPEIDAQHKSIVEEMNRLHEAVTIGLGRESVMEVLEFAERYTREHFAFEEKCMNAYRCPIASKNKAAHAAFIKRFGELREQVEQNTTEQAVTMDIYYELRYWIRDHIMQIDKQMKLCGKGQSGSDSEVSI